MIIATIYILCLIVWGLSFLPELGMRRSLLVSVCRGLWILPLILALIPASESKELPRSIVKTPIHVLIDDSESMKDSYSKTYKFLEKTRKMCVENACELKETLLSDENSLTKKGYTPLRQALETWLGRVGQEAWMLISDGGDSIPNAPWSKEWRGLGQDERKNKIGVLVGVSDEDTQRLWIEDLTLAPISFEGKTSVMDVLVRRKRKSLSSETVQIQVRSEDQVLISENIVFPQGEANVLRTVTLPPLARGKHELEVRLLAAPGDKILWDKVAHASIDVISNTVGVLHLLGSPSWDGRFLRRYLKSEPKYDLISFFILRDPWDPQLVDEKEMSLIPFPVARLFNQELGKFRVVILQNFNLLQFLTPQYQQNLVEYVKAGGSLFFIGGPRALQSHDLQNSPLRELLPFDTKTGAQTPIDLWGLSEGSVDKNGPWFDKELRFTISLAHPSADKLALADVFEEWGLDAESIQLLDNLKGLHHMENVHFKSEHTPLLDAVTSEGKRIPFAVASYPGKGRAIWIFSDQMWRVAMNPQSDISRSVYNHLVESSFSWLMRYDFRKPLALSQFQLQSNGKESVLQWSVDLEGPAVHYLEAGKKWRLRVCEQEVDLYKSTLMKIGASHAVLSGTVDLQKQKNKVCAFTIYGEHSAFGSLSESILSSIPDLLKDENVGGSDLKMRQLSELTLAPLLSLNEWDKTIEFVGKWVSERTGHQGVLIPARFRTILNPYWVLDSWWYFLLLIFLPFEVLVRRWPKLRS